MQNKTYKSYEVWKVNILTGEKEESVFATLTRAKAEQRLVKCNDDRTPEDKRKFRFDYVESSTHRIAFYARGVNG